jgi:hypothetical protein
MGYTKNETSEKIHTFMIKTFNKIVTEENLLNLMKTEQCPTPKDKSIP